MAKTALVLINMQFARNEKNSDYYLEEFDRVIHQSKILLEHARIMDYKVIFIKNNEKSGSFSPDHPDSQILPELSPKSDDVIINKWNISSFYQTLLTEELEGVENLIVAGVLTNLCVRMFVEEAYDRGFRIALIEDATASFSPEIQEITLEDLYDTRPELAILSVEEFIQ